MRSRSRKLRGMAQIAYRFRGFLFIFLAVILPLLAEEQTAAAASDSVAPLVGPSVEAESEASVSEPVGEPPELDLPFPIGEELFYDIHWGALRIGTSHNITEWEWVEDRWLLVIRSRTQTNGLVEALYPVDDKIDSYIDPETLRTLEFRMDLKEGKNKRKQHTLFDWNQNKALITREKNGKVKENQVDIQDASRDLVSFMYFLRDTDFQEQSEYDFEVLTDEKLYDLTINTKGVEKIRLRKFGKVKSLKMIPKASFEGIFVRRGEMKVWVSDDERRVLTKAWIDTPFANVTLKLRKVKGPGDDDWVTRSQENEEEEDDDD